MGIIKIPAEIPELTDYSNRFSLSYDNEYIPIYGVHWGEWTGNYLAYGFPSAMCGYHVRMRGRIGLFCDALTSDEAQVINRFKSDGKLYYGCYGTIMYLNEITYELSVLMALCIKERYLKKIMDGIVEDKFFALVISQSFLGEAHSKMLKPIETRYMKNMLGKIDLVHVPDIEESCFKSSIPEPQHNTVADMVSHFRGINRVLATHFLGGQRPQVDDYFREFNRDVITTPEPLHQRLSTSPPIRRFRETHVISAEAEEEDPLDTEMREIAQGVELIDDEAEEAQSNPQRELVIPVGEAFVVSVGGETMLAFNEVIRREAERRGIFPPDATAIEIERQLNEQREQDYAEEEAQSAEETNLDRRPDFIRPPRIIEECYSLPDEEVESEPAQETNLARLLRRIENSPSNTEIERQLRELIELGMVDDEGYAIEDNEEEENTESNDPLPF